MGPKRDFEPFWAARGRINVGCHPAPLTEGGWYQWFKDDGGVFLLEFAGGRGWWKRHCLVQTAEDAAVLLGKEEDIYKEQSLWGQWSHPHCNNNTVLMLKRS